MWPYRSTGRETTTVNQLTSSLDPYLNKGRSPGVEVTTRVEVILMDELTKAQDLRLNERCLTLDRLAGLVVKVSTSKAEDPGFESHSRRNFSGVESYQ